MQISIRESLDSDLEVILSVERSAFGAEDEAHLVRNLLKDDSAKPYVSLLAFQNEQAVGHILFTKVDMEPKSNDTASILCPMAVIPKLQKQGIGGQLIRQGLEILSKRDVGLVFVLGYPSYYTRHGFRPAGKLGFEPTYAIAEKNADAWMVQELQPNIARKYKGKVICPNALNKPEYWSE